MEKERERKKERESWCKGERVGRGGMLFPLPSLYRLLFIATGGVAGR